MKSEYHLLRLSIPRNVALVYLDTVLSSAAHALWQGPLLSQWIYAVSPDERSVGKAVSLIGWSKICSSLLCGQLVDRCPRNAMLVSAGALGIAEHAFIAGLVLATGARFEHWCFALVVHGDIALPAPRGNAHPEMILSERPGPFRACGERQGSASSGTRC